MLAGSGERWRQCAYGLSGRLRVCPSLSSLEEQAAFGPNKTAPCSQALGDELCECLAVKELDEQPLI